MQQLEKGEISPKEQGKNWIAIRNDQGQILFEVHASNPCLIRRVIRGQSYEINIFEYLLKQQHAPARQ